ncbi:MAG: NAD+ synthase [Flavobacteriales bacterium]|nr:MAG: NAD+ synthase [Flavobacteriales bacterium]
MSGFKIALAQLNFTIGDFESNTAKMADVIFQAKQDKVDLVVFSELSVCGYIPEDLLDYAWFTEKCENALEAVARTCVGIAAVVGGVMRNPSKGRSLQNVACMMYDGRIQEIVPKTLLPNYDVFNENRYFQSGTESQVIEFKGVKIGIAICEDLWDIYNDFEYLTSPGKALKSLGAELIINPSASPFNLGKHSLRNAFFGGHASRFDLPVLYVNQVGVHTELIFDGSSRAINGNGEVVLQAPSFEETVVYTQFKDGQFEMGQSVPLETNDTAQLYKSLIFGIRDYFKKMGFTHAILGASGGIDSAVVQVLATEALGAKNVHPILMPSMFSSDHSVTDAEKLAAILGNIPITLPIKDIYDTFLTTLGPVFAGSPFGLAEENIQARARAVLLMSVSNKMGHILLNTSNKSELSVGYSTLYGDLCGAVSPLGDVYKTQVYALAKYINRQQEIIPKNILIKSPSAELSPGQKDSDSLPDYPVLDEILTLYIELKKGHNELITMGYDAVIVNKVIALVNKSEYKRYQAPPILRVSAKAFGKGRIMPLVANYNSQ